MTETNLDYLHPQLRPLAVKVADLTPDPRNARKRDRRALDALKASIESKGFRSTIIVQKNEAGELIIRAGNGRHQAMTELGYEYIPALIFEEGDEDAIAFAIADNRTAELAEWDFEALGEHLGALDDADLPGVGFSKDEVDTLLANNDWGGFDFDEEDDAPRPDPAEAGENNGPKHEQETPKIVIKVVDVTARVELLKAVKALIDSEFEGRAKV